MTANVTTSLGRPDRPTSSRAIALLAVATIRMLLRRKRLIFLVLLLLAPPFLTTVLKVEGVPTEEGFATVAPQAFFLFLGPIVTLFHGAGIFADEIDGRTMVYLLMRPVSREALLFGKALGVWVVSTLLLWGSALATHVPSVWDGTWRSFASGDLWDPFVPFALLLALATLLYTAISLLFGLVLRHPILIGIVYMLVVEAAFCWAPGPPSRVAISYHVTRLLPDFYVTPEEMVAAARGVSVVEPNPVFVLIGLGTTFAAVLLLCVVAIRSSDLASGEDD